MVNIIISLLHMDDISLNLASSGSTSMEVLSDLYNSTWEHTEFTHYEGGNKMVISFTEELLDILRQHLPSSLSEKENAMSGGVVTSIGRQALEWRITHAKRFIEDWEWRLSILQRLLPLSERQWRWKEALTVLRAAPSELLNLYAYLCYNILY